ncbi:ABC transporter permease [bacterium]|nr:ABC transporter permease [bacterium]
MNPRLPSPGRMAWRRFRRNGPSVASAAVLVVVVIGAIVGPWLSTYAFNQLSDAQFQAPSAGHWFGTDVHGRDVLTRVLVGARISLLVGVVATAVSLVIGVTWGAVAGYAGGRTDSVMMRVVDVLYALPYIIFVIVLITTLDGVLRRWLTDLGGEWLADRSRMILLFVGLGAVSWLTMARIVRGQVLRLRSLPFVEASRAQGARPGHIIRRHVLPNTWGVVIVYLTLTLPAVILQESFLSFLGLGIQPPRASWGSLIADGAAVINPIRIYWWLLVFPGGMMALTLLALNFVGEGLRDAFDPRSRAGTT